MKRAVRPLFYAICRIKWNTPLGFAYWGMFLTTPSASFPELEKFRVLLGINAEAEFIPVKPRLSSEIDDCFEDVRLHVKKHGGKMVVGWQIWLWDNVMAEAIFHAVWQSHSGQLIDVSYKEEGEEMIMFLRDDTRKYEGKRVPSIRVPVSKHESVLRFVKASDELQKYEGELTGEEYLGEVHGDKKYLELKLRYFQTMEAVFAYLQSIGEE